MKRKNGTRHILATNVTFLRHERNWSQFDLSERSNRSVSFISDVENATISASLDAIDDLAFAFDIETFELVKEQGYRVVKKRHDSKF